MHDTAYLSGEAFAVTYGQPGMIVVDIGGLSVNGSLRDLFTSRGMTYICVDIEPHDSVDVVVKPGEPLPFEDGIIDLIVSSSCFEHDPCFWITFREMTRIIKPEGYIYVSAPSNGIYHMHPGDNWRFYSDAGQALAYWSGYQYGNERVFPVKVIETYHVLPLNDIWIDFVCIWQRTDTKETEILVSNNIIGASENYLRNRGLNTEKKVPWLYISPSMTNFIVKSS
jgi:SAM-dependent methyltransferase